MTNNIKDGRDTMEQMYLERDQLGDVTFLVEDQRIRAHRNILATQSPKYKAQFYGPHRDEGEIRVPNVLETEFDVFLQFFYKRTIALTMDNIEAVLDLARQSLVDEFVEACINFLKIQIKANKLCVPYRLATLYEIEALRLECERQITTNTMDVFASDDFLRCDREMLLEILKLGALSCKEKAVFDACIAWAREQCKRINMDDGKPENLRAALGDAIYQIRFSSFTAEEFAALHKSMEGLFTPDETIELMYMTGKLNDFKPQKFNATPRTKEPKECLNMRPFWKRELDLRASIVEAFVGIVEHVEFSFSCVSPVRLHGIVLGIHFSEAELKRFPGSISVRATDGDAMDNDLRFQFVPMKYKFYRYAGRTDETLIIFDKPIERVIEFGCAIQLPPKQLNYELILHRSIGAGKLLFLFGSGNSKWVSRICFDNYAA